jgi:hypothetical protein
MHSQLRDAADWRRATHGVRPELTAAPPVGLGSHQPGGRRRSAKKASMRRQASSAASSS